MLLTHPSSCRPSCAQEWHSMALHRHVPASQFQLWLHCPSWGCFPGFLELQIWETSSKHNLRRAPLVSQTEVACTSGEFGPHFIWPTVTLIAKNHQTPNPKTHEERHFGWNQGMDIKTDNGAWRAKKIWFPTSLSYWAVWFPARQEAFHALQTQSDTCQIVQPQSALAF